MAKGKRYLSAASEQEVIDSAGIFKLSANDALCEVHDTVRISRIYARTQGLSFLAYLLSMVEIEVQQQLADAGVRTD